MQTHTHTVCDRAHCKDTFHYLPSVAEHKKAALCYHRANRPSLFVWNAYIDFLALASLLRIPSTIIILALC